MPSSREPHSVDGLKKRSSGALSTAKRNQIAGSWIFGVLLLAFLFYAFVFSPDALSVTKQRILAFVCALIAGLFGFFLIGSIKVTVHPESNSDLDHKRSNSGIRSVGVEASGGFAAAVLVLLWWLSPWAPVQPAKPDEKSITLYKVRVTVLDPGELPVENSQIRSSLGGELKKVAGGWELDIPSSNKPADGRLTLYALTPDSSLRGLVDLRLEADPNLTATIHLQETQSNSNASRPVSDQEDKSSITGRTERTPARGPTATSSISMPSDSSIRVLGRVIDDSSRASIPGVKVFIVGFEKEAVLSGDGGEFNLPAHAAEGKMIRLRVEKEGYETKEQLHPAGRVHVTLLMREK